MLQDALTSPGEADLHADVCIVGGGPAAMALAAEFDSHGQRAIVLESGGLDAENDAQDLNRNSGDRSHNPTVAFRANVGM